MKIAFILPRNSRSGGTRKTVVAANQLLARGHKVRIFYHKHPKTLRIMFRSLRNKLIYSGRYAWIETFEGSTIGIRDITECKFASDEIIVAVGIWCSAELGRLSSIQNPKVQYLRGMAFWMPEKMERALSSNIPKIVLSSHDREYVKSHYNWDVVEIIPNGVKVDEYYPEVPEDERTGVGTIYSGHPAKDPDTILALLDKLREKHPDVAQYIFGVYPRPRGISKQNYFRFPSVPKARQIYSRCKVWILASRSEGFGMPILEAMACGCAVIATDCGGPSDIINDGENGFLVDIGDVEKIINRVGKLLKDSALREKFVKNSQETIGKFAWTSSISKLERVLAKISGQR